MQNIAVKQVVYYTGIFPEAKSALDMFTLYVNF